MIRLPLSRRDRAALTLALEMLRVTLRGRPELYGAGDAVGLNISAGFALDDVYGVLSRAAKAAPFAAVMRDHVLTAFRATPHINERLLRARLALLLRAVLRADAGDVYSRPCEACAYNGRESRMVYRCRHLRGVGSWLVCPQCGDDVWQLSLRITPAWELAPPHGQPRQRREQ